MIAPVQTVAEVTEAELRPLQDTLPERSGEVRELQFGEAEIGLNRQDRQPTTSPIVAWQDDASTPLVARAGDGDYRAHQRYGTGIDRFDNLAECMVSLLQLQADHARDRQQETGEAPRR